MSQPLDGGELFLLTYLFCNHLAFTFVYRVSVRVVLRAEDLVKSAVDELDSTVVFNGDSDAAGFPDHIPEVFSPGDSSRLAVVVGAVYSSYEPETSYVGVLPFSWVIKRHRIGMSGIEPADRSCTDTREHSSVLVSGLNKFIDAQTTPNAHHLQGVSTTNVDDVCRQDLFPDMLFRRLLLDEQEDVRPALQKFAEILLDTLPISFGIRTRGWNKEQLRILFVRKSDSFSIDRGGSSSSYLPAADGNNHLLHLFILLLRVGFGRSAQIPGG